jgi:thioredoxin
MSNLTVVDIWAEWCGPCKKFAPIFEALKEKHPEITWYKVDADDPASAEIIQRFNVRGIPTILIIRDDDLIFSHAGILSEAQVENLISTYAE